MVMIMRYLPQFISIALISCLAACAHVPPLSDSREHVWQQFNNRRVDELLLAWGPPASDTQRPDGTRVLSYSYSNSYDYGTPKQRTYTCKATFYVVQPDMRIIDLSLAGPDYECAVLGHGYTGQKGTPVGHPNTFLRENPPLF